MVSRERVIATINHQKADRMPVYGWLNNDDFSKKVNEAFGSIRNFEEKYHFDLAHLFPQITPHNWSRYHEEFNDPDEIEPSMVLDIPLMDPDNQSLYQTLIEDIRYHKEEKGRFVYVQTPGAFEENNTPFGIQNHLINLSLYPNEMKEIYNRLQAWTIRFANNCLDLGVDMIHISDDWGAQNSLLFSPDFWWSHIMPYHKAISDAVKKRGGYLSLHSDGNIMQVLDGIVEIGFDVVHPFQVSAGMDLDVFNRQYKDKFTVMGGIDIQTTLGFGDYARLKAEIFDVIKMFGKAGMILCTTHMVQPHCSIEELVFAYDCVYEAIDLYGKGK